MVSPFELWHKRSITKVLGFLKVWDLLWASCNALLRTHRTKACTLEFFDALTPSLQPLSSTTIMPSTKNLNCPNVLASGVCLDPHCRLTHNVLVCEPCGFIAANANVYNSHVQSKKHQSKVAGRSGTAYCIICKKNIAMGSWHQHVAGQKHVARAKTQALAPNIEPEPEAATNNNQRNCSICQQIVRRTAWNQHLLSVKHRRKEAFTKYKAALDEAGKDKNGVSIEGTFDFDFVDPAVGAMGLQSTVTIKTSLPFSKSVLVEAKLASSQGPRVSASW
jgi:helicase MOV-10